MIRQATELDGLSIAHLIVYSWQTAYRGLIDDTFLNNLDANILSKNWGKHIANQNDDNHIYVYEENDKILGVIRFGKPNNETTNYNAEIHVLYVEPSLKRQGIGSKLFTFAKNYFINKNTINMIIWCLNNNIPAIRFYEKMGGKISATRKSVVNKIEVDEVGLEYILK